jgi:hypothetical protein
LASLLAPSEAIKTLIMPPVASEETMTGIPVTLLEVEEIE